MAYCTEADLTLAVGGAARLKQLVDRDGNNANDAGVVDAAIAAADALIDSYANKRFAVPFNPVPPAIKELSKRLARYQLRDERATLSQADIETHKADVEWLEALAEGKVSPGVEPQPTKSSLMRDSASERPSTKEVGRSQLKGYW